MVGNSTVYVLSTRELVIGVMIRLPPFVYEVCDGFGLSMLIWLARFRLYKRKLIVKYTRRIRGSNRLGLVVRKVDNARIALSIG